VAPTSAMAAAILIPLGCLIVVWLPGSDCRPLDRVFYRTGLHWCASAPNDIKM
jgi:hypothetical protein